MGKKLNLVLGAIIFWLFFHPGLLWANKIDHQPHELGAQDSISSLLLRYTCITSMDDYRQAQEAFGQLNPGIVYSDQLQVGATVLVPVFKKPGPGCLSYQSGQILRVEFEPGIKQEVVRIYLDGPVLPHVFTLKDQDSSRLVCDFDGFLPQTDLERHYEPQGRLIHKIRVGHQDKPLARARVVLELDPGVDTKIQNEFMDHESIFVLTIIEQNK